MRLIDGDALAKFIDYGHLNNPNEKLYSENDIREMIDMMPTVDAVPVIRCKDCKHYADEQCDRYADETLGYVHSTQADGYCWVAERKEK